MYIVRRKISATKLAFKTYEGWAEFDANVVGDVLDLSDVIRFTSNEAHLNVLPNGEDWVEFGCYKELKYVRTTY